MFTCPYEEQCEEYLEENNLEPRCQFGYGCGYYPIFEVNEMSKFMKSSVYAELMKMADKVCERNDKVITGLLQKTKKRK